MNFSIEVASIDDLEDIQNLSQLLFEKEFKEFDNKLNCDWTFGDDGTNYFRKSIEDDTACTYIAKVNGEVVGYLVGWKIKKPCSWRTIKIKAELENMFVREEFRSHGIGSSLVHEFIEWSKLIGATTICVTASARNKAGIDFYRNNGFIDYDITLEQDLS